MKFDDKFKALMEGLKSGSFMHASNTPNMTLETLKVPDVPEGRHGSKPRGGLWMTPGTEWNRWTISEDFYPKSWTHLYKISVDLSKVKVLTGDPYEIPDKYHFLENEYTSRSDPYYYVDIDWHKYVKKHKFTGLYFKGFKAYYRTYSGGDVEALVIFDKSAIKSVKYVGDFSKSVDKRVDKRNEWRRELSDD